MEEIRFYFANEKKGGVYSNFALYPILVDGWEYPSSENYYQSKKYESTGLEDRIREQTCKRAWALGNKYPERWREDWEEVKDDVMRVALYSKFTQHPELKKQLLETGEAKLVEAAGDRDYYWGIGTPDKKGLNKLGLFLMDLRLALRSGNLEEYTQLTSRLRISPIQERLLGDSSNNKALNLSEDDKAILATSSPQRWIEFIERCIQHNCLFRVFEYLSNSHVGVPEHLNPYYLFTGPLKDILSVERSSNSDGLFVASNTKALLVLTYFSYFLTHSPLNRLGHVESLLQCWQSSRLVVELPPEYLKLLEFSFKTIEKYLKTYSGLSESKRKALPKTFYPQRFESEHHVLQEVYRVVFAYHGLNDQYSLELVDALSIKG